MNKFTLAMFAGALSLAACTDIEEGCDSGEELDSAVASVGVDQVLGRNATFQLAYAFAHMRGFLANPYRSISFGVATEPETHPDTRLDTAMVSAFTRASVSLTCAHCQ